jgi:anti-anti-sigma factor
MVGDLAKAPPPSLDTSGSEADMARPEDLRVQTERGVTIVCGEVDLSTCSVLEEALTIVGDPLVLDLAGVGFMDSSGIRVLVRQHQRRNGGGGVRVIAMSRGVQRILEVAGMLETFSGDVEPGESAAG